MMAGILLIPVRRSAHGKRGGIKTQRKTSEVSKPPEVFFLSQGIANGITGLVSLFTSKTIT